MKQKDLGLIVVIVIFSAIISLLVSNAIFASPDSRQQEVEVVEPISTDFPKPDRKYFNKNAFDPTKNITIEQSDNATPFNGVKP